MKWLNRLSRLASGRLPQEGIIREPQGLKSRPVARGVHSLRTAANFGKDCSVATLNRELDSGLAQKFTTEEARTK